VKNIFYIVEDFLWKIRCQYNFWLHGPYGLAKVIEKIPFRFLIKYLRIYGASIGGNCRFERGLNIHRPSGKKPFENLFIGNNVYLGHNTLIDLSRKIIIKDDVIIASNCQLWTHASYYDITLIKSFEYRENFGEITIDKGAIIYSGVVITHDVRLGSFSIVGANSLLNKSIQKNQFWGGVPARYLGNREDNID
jgi:acetyltransferase-like isoleucine patch superfamily enzyme